MLSKRLSLHNFSDSMESLTTTKNESFINPLKKPGAYNKMTSF